MGGNKSEINCLFLYSKEKVADQRSQISLLKRLFASYFLKLMSDQDWSKGLGQIKQGGYY